MDVFLLPGMDGTGLLYARLKQALPETWRTTVLEFPSDVVAGYDELLGMVKSNAPGRPFLLLAESYSTPLAIRFAATRAEHLVGVVLCAGFASSPFIGWRRQAGWLLSSVLFRMPLTDSALRWFLIGEGAESSLEEEVRAAIASLRPAVLAARLREILDCDVCSDLAQCDVPILYLQAEKDRLVGPRCLEGMRRSKERLLVERIDGRHLLFQREPFQSAEAIGQFARRIGIIEGSSRHAD